MTTNPAILGESRSLDLDIMLCSVLNVNGLHDFTPQKTELVIIAAVGTSNPTSLSKFIIILGHLMMAQEFAYPHIIHVRK
jgi:hypothetical protein